MAVVDGTRTLAPADWLASDRLWVVRPRDGADAFWAAEELARSGAFGLVAVDGERAAVRRVGARLRQAARDGGAAVVVLETAP